MRATLWTAADELRANRRSGRPVPAAVLGLIFLAYAEHRFEEVRPELEAKATAEPVTADDYKARSVLYVPEVARLSSLVDAARGRGPGQGRRRGDEARSRKPTRS